VSTIENVPYAFVRRGGRTVKQEIATGAMNDTHVIVTAGLEDGEQVLLVPPADAASMTPRRLNGDEAADTSKGASRGTP
jgi:hypothetical protein